MCCYSDSSAAVAAKNEAATAAGNSRKNKDSRFAEIDAAADDCRCAEMEGLKLLLSERGFCSTEFRLGVADADVAEVPALMQTKRVSQVSHMLQRLKNFLVADVVEQTLQKQLLLSHPCCR